MAFLLVLPSIAIAREPLLERALQTATLSLKEVSRDTETGKFVSDIIVDPNGQSINAVFASMSFSTSSLRIINLDTENSFCELFIDESFDNETGTISIMCGKPYPGIDAKANVGQVTFEKINQKETTISFSPDAMVLANDGYGTNVLATTTSLNIQ